MARRLPSEICLEAGELNDEGLARGAFAGKRVDIKNALPGESVTARVVGRRKGRFFAEAQSQDNVNEERVKPICEHFPRCGGCVLQHQDPGSQLAAKARRLQRALVDQGLGDIPIPGTVQGPFAGYRARARLGVRRLASGVVVGFRESFSNRVLNMRSCQVLVPVLSQAVRELAPVLDRLSIADRIPQLEVAAGDDGAEIVLRHLQPLTDADRECLEDFERSSDVRLVLQSGGYETLQFLDGSAYEPRLGYLLPEHGLHMRFGAADFTQVNAQINRKLVSAAMAELKPRAGDRVLDLFCGIGNFSLPIARSGARVLGLESSASAVERARSNAVHNGLQGRCEFQVADLYDPAAAPLPLVEKILLDPPRSGAGSQLERWLSPVTQVVVYVSCHPESFAGDAKRLARCGLLLASVSVFDMFPHTTHVETLGVFRRQPVPGRQD